MPQRRVLQSSTGETSVEETSAEEASAGSVRVVGQNSVESLVDVVAAAATREMMKTWLTIEQM